MRGQCSQRAERQMIRMRVREENRIDRRKLGHLNAGHAHPRQEEAELVVEIGIGQDGNAAKLQQQRSMANVREPKPRRGLTRGCVT